MAELETRYIVLKLTDVEKLDPVRRGQLEWVCLDIQAIRRERNVTGHIACIVVEKDWPEYEPTLAAILARVDGVKGPDHG